MRYICFLPLVSLVSASNQELTLHDSSASYTPDRTAASTLPRVLKDFHRETSQYSRSELRAQISLMSVHFDASEIIRALPQARRNAVMRISNALEDVARQSLAWWIQNKELFAQISDSSLEPLVREAYESYPALGVSSSLAFPIEIEVDRLYKPGQWTPTLKSEKRFARDANNRKLAIASFIQRFVRYLVSAKRRGLLEHDSLAALSAMREADRIMGLLIDMKRRSHMTAVLKWQKEPGVDALQYDDSLDKSIYNDDSDDGSVDFPSNDSMDDDRDGEKEQAKLKAHYALVSEITALRSEVFDIAAAQRPSGSTPELIVNALNLAAIRQLEWLNGYRNLVASIVDDWGLEDDIVDAKSSFAQIRSRELFRDETAGRVVIEQLLADDNDIADTDHAAFRHLVETRVNTLSKFLLKFFKLFTSGSFGSIPIRISSARYPDITEALKEAEALHLMYSSQPLDLLQKWKKWLVDSEIEYKRELHEKYERMRLKEERIRLKKKAEREAKARKATEERRSSLGRTILQSRPRRDSTGSLSDSQ